MKCQNCHKREGTVRWVGDTGVMGWIHGMSQWWCKQCCLKESLKYAKHQAKRIVKLEKQLKRIIRK